LSSLGWADAVMVTHLCVIGLLQPHQTMEFIEKALPELHGVLTRHSYTQQDRQEFSVGELIRAQ